MIAGALPAVRAKELALVATLRQPSDYTAAPRLRMTPVFLQYEDELLSNELRARHAALARRACEQSVIRRLERNCRRLLSRKCHGSNITSTAPRATASRNPFSGAITRLLLHGAVPDSGRARQMGQRSDNRSFMTCSSWTARAAARMTSASPASHVASTGLPSNGRPPVVAT